MRYKKQIEQRENFIEIYNQFNVWLTNLGFRTGHYWNDASTQYDYHYTHYNDLVDAMYSVECYVHDELNFKIRFLRDRNEHKFIFITGECGSTTPVLSLDESKQLILSILIEGKMELIRKLEKLNF